MTDSEIVRGMIRVIWEPEKIEDEITLGQCLNLYGRLLLSESRNANQSEVIRSRTEEVLGEGVPP